MKHLNCYSLVFTLAICISCGDSSGHGDKNDCPVPPPKAIFDKTVEGISNHKFELSGRDSEEAMEFDDGTTVTIYQSGCDKIVQEYRFTLAPSMDESKTALAVARFNYMARLGTDYMTFGGWANAIDGLRKEFEHENTLQVEPGLFISLDKLDSKSRSILIVRLFQK